MTSKQQEAETPPDPLTISNRARRTLPTGGGSSNDLPKRALQIAAATGNSIAGIHVQDGERVKVELQRTTLVSRGTQHQLKDDRLWA